MKNKFSRSGVFSATDLMLAADNCNFASDKRSLLARKIEEGMKLNRLSRQEFAVLMGVQPSIITRWLSGKHNFTVDTLFDIEERLNIKILNIDSVISRSLTLRLTVNSTQTCIGDIEDILPLPTIGTNIMTKTSGFNLSPEEVKDSFYSNWVKTSKEEIK